MAPRTLADWDKLVPELAPHALMARLEAARRALKLSQMAFASRADITPQHYTNWKKGGLSGRPSTHHLVAIAKAHGIPMDYICMGDLSSVRPHALQDEISARLRAELHRNIRNKRNT